MAADIRNLVAMLTGGGVGMAPPTTPFAPTIQDLDAQRERELIQRASQVEPDLVQGPQPRKHEGLRSIGAALADALSTYGAGLAGNPSLATNFSDILRQRREEMSASERENARRRGAASSESDRRRAAIELEDLRARRERGEKRADIAEGREYEEKSRLAADERRAGREREEMTSREMIALMEDKTRRGIAELEAKTRLGIAGMEKNGGEDRHERERQVEGITAFKQAALELKRKWQDKAALGGANLTAEIESLADDLDVMELSPERKQAAWEFVKEKLLPLAEAEETRRQEARAAAVDAKASKSKSRMTGPYAAIDRGIKSVVNRTPADYERRLPRR